MSKSLSESAAEILSASVAGAAKEPMVSGGAGAQVIGGATTENPAGEENMGAKAAAVVGKNAPPMSKGDAKAVKVSAMEEVETDEEVELTEEELEEYLNSLSEEELAALADELELSEAKSMKDKDEEDDEEEDDEEEDDDKEKMKEEVELSEEEIAEARKAAMKEMVAKNMGSCKEDIDALFNGEALSEEFRGKAITIFEAAVRARVEAIAENLFAENEEILAETVASIEEDLANNVDEYLNYVVEHWMSENELAIETGLRTEIAEEFMEGLKNLFTEHYMEVPEEKADLVEEMAERVVEAEELLEAALVELETAQKTINEAKSKEILSLTCEGLTKVQAEKIKALAEGVEFTTEGDYKHKLAVIRESYFPTNKPVKSEVQNLIETSGGEEVSGVMDYYVNAISKTLPK